MVMEAEAQKHSPKRILITGASGLVGRALAASYQQQGVEVFSLVRSEPKSAKEIRWNPATGEVDLAKLEAFDAVIHLAGENVFGLWTEKKKRAIKESRVMGTRNLAAALAKITHKPKVLISASAIGIYGNRADEVLTESSKPGSGFLADVGREWEQAADAARDAGIRVVHPRISIVLAKEGGALDKMKLPFSLGLGGRLGSGKQWFSWITLEDLIRLIQFAVENESISGPINAAAPEPVTNADFTRALAKKLHRPAFMHVPAFALRLAPGGMGEETFLVSERVLPEKAQRAGFSFHSARLDQALDRLVFP
jgi:uncharacterized protein (TIGR01777 family)